MKQPPSSSRQTKRASLYPNAVHSRQRMQKFANGLLCALSTLGITGVLFVLIVLC